MFPLRSWSPFKSVLYSVFCVRIILAEEERGALTKKQRERLYKVYFNLCQSTSAHLDRILKHFKIKKLLLA